MTDRERIAALEKLAGIQQRSLEIMGGQLDSLREGQELLKAYCDQLNVTVQRLMLAAQVAGGPTSPAGRN